MVSPGPRAAPLPLRVASGSLPVPTAAAQWSLSCGIPGRRELAGLRRLTPAAGGATALTPRGLCRHRQRSREAGPARGRTVRELQPRWFFSQFYRNTVHVPDNLPCQVCEPLFSSIFSHAGSHRHALALLLNEAPSPPAVTPARPQPGPSPWHHSPSSSVDAPVLDLSRKRSHTPCGLVCQRPSLGVTCSGSVPVVVSGSASPHSHGRVPLPRVDRPRFFHLASVDGR